MVALRGRRARAVVLSTSWTLVGTVNTVDEAVTHQTGIHTLATTALVQVGGATSQTTFNKQ